MRAIVAGGGVAGSAAAITLRRIGADVTVYEAYDDPAGPVGSYVSLAVNGLRALDALECLTRVQAAGFPVARHRLWSGSGKLLGDVARGRRPEDPLHSVTLMRADLVTALRAEALESGARIVTGQRLDAASDPRAADADLIVGADGIWSATRRALDPAAPQPAYAGLYSVSGTSGSVPACPGTASTGSSPGTGCSSSFPSPTAPCGGPPRSRARAATRPGRHRRGRAHRTVRCRGAGNGRAAVRRHSAHGEPGARTKPLTRRHGDRIVLIGDAAHPAGAGQGASIAMEDAVVLARHLAVAGTGAIPGALAAFDRERQPRAGKLAKMETSNRDAKTAGPIATRMREMIMPHTFNRFYEKATGWLYDFDPGTLPAVRRG